jgi:hypothetical protein
MKKRRVKFYNFDPTSKALLSVETIDTQALDDTGFADFLTQQQAKRKNYCYEVCSV